MKASETGDSAEILLSISYNGSLARLTVNVVECRNLKVCSYMNDGQYTKSHVVNVLQVDSNLPPDSYVKVQLMLQAKVSESVNGFPCKWKKNNNHSSTKQLRAFFVMLLPGMAKSEVIFLPD